MLFALVSDANGTEVRVTRVAGPSAGPVTATGWEASDIHEAVRALTARGVTFERYAGLDQDADGVWSGPGGTRIAWFGRPEEDTPSGLLSRTDRRLLPRPDAILPRAGRPP